MVATPFVTPNMAVCTTALSPVDVGRVKFKLEWILILNLRIQIKISTGVWGTDFASKTNQITPTTSISVDAHPAVRYVNFVGSID